ncbi:MAG: asparagine synthase (glutamine-hydrolyzing) [Alphaproteobacteria bacterium]
MCGIAGVIGVAPPDGERITAVLAALRHRGPDGRGTYATRLANGQHVLLLNTRLAIRDLELRAGQPMAHDGCVVVHNGEIYNDRELKAELEARGHRFRTASDTEVIAHAWRAWGESMFDRFEGMFALALLDLRAGRLVLARDRFGEKPLLWLRHRDALYFASEIGALAALAGVRPEPNLEQVRRFLVLGYRALHGRTWHQGVGEVPAGSIAVLDQAGEPRPRTYWTPRFAPAPMSYDQAVDGARERLNHAVGLRLRSDVPLAFCLSGGIDSGALAAIAARVHGAEVHGFSVIDDDERYDERANLAEMVGALGCRHATVETERTGFLDRLDALIGGRGQPIATVSYYVHARLLAAVAAAGYKVAISGTGADELVSGYYDHYGFWLAGQARSPDFDRLVEDWRRGMGAHVRNPLLRDPLAFRRNPAERGHLTLGRDVFAALLREPFGDRLTEHTYTDDALRNRMLNELCRESVPVMLREDDLDAMAVSVENRSPYLDSELARFLLTVPTEHLVRDGRLKAPLRDAVAGLLPDPVRLDPRKRGFNASIVSLLDPRDGTTRERLLAPGPIFEVVRRDAFEAFLERDFSDAALSKFLFAFVSARAFLDLECGAASARRAA